MNYKKYTFNFNGTNRMIKQIKQQIQSYCHKYDIDYKFADTYGLIFGECDVVLSGNKIKIDYLIEQLEEWFND